MMDHALIPEDRMKILKRNKKYLDRLRNFSSLDIKINEEIEIVGEDPLTILRVKDVLKAFGRGFNFDDALNLLDEEYYFETIDIKDYAKKSRDRLITLRGRVIGTKGKTKELIEKSAEVKISIYGKTIGIIGKWDRVVIAKKAIEMILLGSLHSTVYRFLQRQKR